MLRLFSHRCQQSVDLAEGTRQAFLRTHLQGLADATGGRCFFIDGTQELDRVYREIESELRTQYLVAYQSPREAGERFRLVEVEMANSEHEAKTIPGYFP